MNTHQCAYAKINLLLHVCSKRPDGYHELSMIMESISIHDDLEISVSDEPGIHLTCRIEGKNLSEEVSLSNGDDNLVTKAAKAILNYARGLNGAATDKIRLSDIAIDVISGRLGLNIVLTKRIPMAAGLAGGSTDAAAALRGINELLELGLGTQELCSIGVSIGADVPYCIRGGSCLAEGIGEKLTPVASPPAAHLLIVKPSIDVPTGNVYVRFDERTSASAGSGTYNRGSCPKCFTPGISDDGAASNPNAEADTPDARMIQALEDGELTAIGSSLYNDLRIVTAADHGIITELEDLLTDAGAAGAMMSGSGPSVFGLFDQKDQCLMAMKRVRDIYPGIYAEYAEFVI